MEPRALELPGSPAPASPPWWRPVAGTASGDAGAPGSAVPFVGLMVFVVVSLIAPQTYVPSLASLRIALLTAVGTLAALVADRLRHGRPLLVPSRETWLAAALAGWAVVSVAFSYWPGGSAALLLDTYAKTLAVFWLLGVVVDTPARLRVAAWTLSLAAVPIAVTGIRNFLSGTLVAGAAQLPVKRILGYDAPLTENPNDLALMLNLILPLTVALWLIHRGRVTRLFLGGVALLAVVAVILTFSRAGFLTLATMTAIYCWRLRKRPERGWAMAVVVLALCAVPFLPSGYLDRLATIASIDSDPTGSAQARWGDTVAAASFVVRHPIVGAGVGMNILALNEERGPAWKMVHNVYLQVAVDLGLPGLVLFLLLLFGSIASVARTRRRAAGDPAARGVFHLAEALEIGLIGFAVAALFYPVAYNFYFYELAGLATAAQAVSGAGCDTSASDC